MGCGFSRWHLMPLGYLIPPHPVRKHCPFDNNLLSACLTSAPSAEISQPTRQCKHLWYQAPPSQTLASLRWQQLSCSRDSPFFSSPSLPSHFLLVLYRDIMSIYKEAPPGMFVVPDTVDMTKVCTLVGFGEIGAIKLEEPKRDYPVHIFGYIGE